MQYIIFAVNMIFLSQNKSEKVGKYVYSF